MVSDLACLAPSLFCLALALSLFPQAVGLARIVTAGGTLVGAGLSVLILTSQEAPVWHLPFGLDPAGTRFQLTAEAAWLIGFGFLAAFWVMVCGPQGRSPRGWNFGAAMGLLGAIGVAGLQDAMSFLVAYEIMSLGGAVMILADARRSQPGRPVLFMLTLLEVGAVAILAAYLALAAGGGSIDFTHFSAAMKSLPDGVRLLLGLLLLLGFGAKLGLIPFYEWFPDAYDAASGATGALMSGIILNVAFFGLGRGMLTWFQDFTGDQLILGILLVALGVLSAILNALYAFQEDRWRRLLAFSSAENGSIAVALLGAALIFTTSDLKALSGLAWDVALLHLAGHTLAKTCLFLTADAVAQSTGDDRLEQRGLLRKCGIWIGVGALAAVMSLAAMPPQAGFVSEWFLFQTFFQAFHATSLAGRLTLVLGGAGLALTAAVAFATSVKLFGLGLQGAPTPRATQIATRYKVSVGVLGFLIWLLAVGMPLWIRGLQAAHLASGDAALHMRDGWLLVPLSATFSFISPSKLTIVMPLLSLVPIAFLITAKRRFAVRRAAVWYGGLERNPVHSATTQLTFSNALRTFYAFVYRPRIRTEREFVDHEARKGYFLRQLRFSHDVAPIFGPHLFRPLERAVRRLARDIQFFQSGSLNRYIGIIGVILLLILATILF
jgi:hydrogenase-4 component B